jgi:hypothetical protein
MRSPAGNYVFAQIAGAASTGIVLSGNSLEPHQQAVTYIDGATEP